MSRVILVTGGNAGIGYELVRLLAEKGHIVYLGARNEAAGKEAEAELRAAGLQDVRYVLLDVTNVAQIQVAKEKIEKEEGKLDVLVNNAAISKMENPHSAVSVDVPVLRDAMETNLYGVIQTTIAFLPLLRKSVHAVIENVSTGLSSGAWMARPDAFGYQYVAYNTSKAAMNSYTIALAQELKKEGIEVNAVTPGFTSSKLNGWSAGGKTLEEGALGLLPYALLEKDGPTGKFFNWDGEEFPCENGPAKELMSRVLSQLGPSHLGEGRHPEPRRSLAFGAARVVSTEITRPDAQLAMAAAYVFFFEAFTSPEMIIFNDPAFDVQSNIFGIGANTCKMLMGFALMCAIKDSHDAAELLNFLLVGQMVGWFRWWAYGNLWFAPIPHLMTMSIHRSSHWRQIGRIFQSCWTLFSSIFLLRLALNIFFESPVRRILERISSIPGLFTALIGSLALAAWMVEMRMNIKHDREGEVSVSVAERGEVNRVPPEEVKPQSSAKEGT